MHDTQRGDYITEEIAVGQEVPVAQAAESAAGVSSGPRESIWLLVTEPDASGVVAHLVLASSEAEARDVFIRAFSPHPGGHGFRVDHSPRLLDLIEWPYLSFPVPPRGGEPAAGWLASIARLELEAASAPVESS